MDEWIQKSHPIRSCRIVVGGLSLCALPCSLTWMAGPHASGAITRQAKRAEMAHAEPGRAARTMASTNT